MVGGIGAVPTAAAATSSSTIGVANGWGDDAPKAPTGTEGSAVAEAERTGKPVDVAAKRSEYSDTVAQPDGRLVTTTYVQPHRVRKSGAWVDIDPTLRRRTDGTLAPAAATADVVFSGGGAGKPLVRMVSRGRELSLSWPTALPTPVVDGSTAEYRSILPDVDLRLTATRTGFTQLVVVRTPAAAKNPALDTLRLGLKADGLALKEAADGTLTAVDKGAGGVVFTAPTPVMWDSSRKAAENTTGAKPKAAPAAPAAQAAAAPAATGTTGQADDYAPHEDAKVSRIAVDFPAALDRLVLTPDQTMLDDPATVFPVMIDPAWNTPNATDWAGVSKYYPTQPYWHFSSTGSYVHDWGVGYCGDTSRCVPKDVKRAFFQIPNSQFIGKQILSAEFGTYESHSYSCSARPVELWSTGYITNKLTWNSQNAAGFWSSKLQTTNAAKGYDSTCPGGWLEFGGTSGPVKDLVQNAANWNWPTITFGLKAENESDSYGWKRFTDDAYLRVNYNLPPRQSPISALSMTPGSCVSTGTTVTTWPKINATATDPDGEAIGVQFAVGWDDGTGYRRRWWSTGSTETTTPASNTFKASGSVFSYQLPALPAAAVGAYGWDMRAWDGASWGPWSSDGDPTNCYFFLDTTAPGVPVVSSDTYPVVDDITKPLAAADGVGRYGTFTLDAPDNDVVKYQWGVDTAAPDHDLATTNGAPQSISVLPTTPGQHRIVVRAVDAADHASGLTTYFFNALDGQTERANWSMDDTGGTATAGTPAKVSAALNAGTSLQAAGHAGTALAFNGTGGAYIDGPAGLLDTGRSFTVSVWANIANADVTRTAVSQAGANTAFFDLGERSGKWSFTTFTKDLANGFGWQSATGTTAVVPNRWTHLTGVYDSAAAKVFLYVDGTLAAQAAAPSSFGAVGPLEFGRLRYMGANVDPWMGSLDEARMWSRALSASEVAQVAGDAALSSGVPAKSVWHFDEPAGATSTAGAPESDALALEGGAKIQSAGIRGTAATFDGVDDRAHTAHPAVDATRSFSVAAWARLPKPADSDTRKRTIVTQSGAHVGEFALSYAADTKKWVFTRYKEDTATAALVTASQPSCTPATPGTTPCFGPSDGQWTYLVGVSDATARKIRLYVNGFLVSETDFTQTAPTAAPGFLQVGAGAKEGASNEFFDGDIDEVRAWDRVVTGPEIASAVRSKPVVAGRWKLDEQSGTTPATTPDDSPAAAHATLLGTAATDAPSVYLDGTALNLDGTTGAAESTTTPLHTDRSFTLTMWAGQAGDATRDMTLLSVPGSSGTAVSVRWHYLGLDPTTQQPKGEWQATVAGTDGTTGATATAAHAPGQNTGNWSHLTVVYDGLAGQLSLLVDGVPDMSNCNGQPLGCTARSTAQPAFRPFDAASAVSGQARVDMGGTKSAGTWGQYFSGQVDDVWAFQGVLDDRQIEQLVNPNTVVATSGLF